MKRPADQRGAGVGEKDSAEDLRHAECSDQQRSPRSAVAPAQHTPHSDRAGGEEQTDDHEVGDLDPSEVAQAQQAERVTFQVEAVAGEGLKQDRTPR